MIRLPPSLIVLAPSDILDVRWRHVVFETELTLPESKHPDTHSTCFTDAGPSIDVDLPELLTPSGVSDRAQSEAQNVEMQRNYDPIHSLDRLERTSGSSGVGRQHILDSSPSKDDFRYGEYIERPDAGSLNCMADRYPPSKYTATAKPLRSCLLTALAALDHTTTPRQARTSEALGIPARARTGRSPLFASQNAVSSSPERATVSLTPRVAAHVAFDNSPGMMFAQPPRRSAARASVSSPGAISVRSLQRPAARSPRGFRHQANSFSFDVSERDNVGYDQGRNSSTSTTNSLPRPSHNLSLRDELRGSSLQSSRNPSGAQASIAGASTISRTGPNIQDEGNTRQASVSGSLFPLPPPFSAVSRNSSGAQSLPPTPLFQHYQAVLDDTNAMFSSSPSTDHNNAPSSERRGPARLAALLSREPEASVLPETPVSYMYSSI